MVAATHVRVIQTGFFGQYFLSHRSQVIKDVYDSWMRHELVLNLVIHSWLYQWFS